jgi:hypothetical protein
MIPFISVVHGATAKATAQDFVTKINEAILFPVIALLMAVAFIVFLYGAFIFVKNANNEAARETGRNHLIYGVIGMLVMLSAFAILSVAANTFGLGAELDEAGNTSTTGTFGTAGQNTARGPAGGATAPAATAPTTPTSAPARDTPRLDTTTLQSMIIDDYENLTTIDEVFYRRDVRAMTTDIDGVDREREINLAHYRNYISTDTRDALLRALQE